MNQTKFNTLRAYLMETYALGDLLEIAKYGVGNVAHGDLIYTSKAVDLALRFSDDIDEVFTGHDIDPFESYNRSFMADLKEIAVHLLYGAVEMICWEFDAAYENLMSDLNEIVSEYNLDTAVHPIEDIEAHLWELELEPDVDDIYEALEKEVRDLIEGWVNGKTNNYISLRLIGGGGSFHTIEADDAYDLAVKWADFSEDYCGAYKVLGGYIGGVEVEEGASIDDLICYYY